MSHTYTYHTKEYFWGETFSTDRRLSIISDISLPEMVGDHSEDSETSGDDNYHLSSTKLFDTYHDTPPRTLLTQVNRTYAKDNHHYPDFPLRRSGAKRSTRRSSNVLQTLESDLGDPRPTNRSYGTWPLCNDSNQVACSRHTISVPPRPSLQHFNTDSNASSLRTDSTSSAIPRCSSTKSIVNHEISYFEHSDDEGSDDEGGGGLTGKAMKRFHIRSPSASKIADMGTGSLRRFFRSKK